MIINTLSPQLPTLNSDVIRPQKSPDSSPESTVIQNRHVAPIPDARVVQQGNESSDSNALHDARQDPEQEGVQQRDDNQGQKEHGKDEQGKKGEAAESRHSSELLTEEEQREVEQLAQRDLEVRAHEQAHLSAAGNRAVGGASFGYVNGPDGKRYASGGEVSIDTSSVPGDPEATLRAAELIQRAALAPAEPSAQDRQVAANANVMAFEARAEISQQRVEQSQKVTTKEHSMAAAGGEPVAHTESDSRDEVTKYRQQQLEGVVGAVEQGGIDDPRGGELDYYL